MIERSARWVVVVGAGVSGVISAAHLKAEGLDVTVFERAPSPLATGVMILIFFFLSNIVRKLVCRGSCLLIRGTGRRMSP